MSALTLTFVHDCPHAGHNCLDQARTSGEEEIYFQASETRQTSPHVKVTLLLAARRDPPGSSINIYCYWETLQRVPDELCRQGAAGERDTRVQGTAAGGNEVDKP